MEESWGASYADKFGKSFEGALTGQRQQRLCVREQERYYPSDELYATDSYRGLEMQPTDLLLKRRTKTN